LEATKKSSFGQNEIKKFAYPTNGNPFEHYAKVETADVFPFMLAFAMTIHKAQGEEVTIDKVVIEDLTCHPPNAAFMQILELVCSHLCCTV
jgi:ATP-dependent exoDNAse (exonuclease V) alpha subunit